MVGKSVEEKVKIIKDCRDLIISEPGEFILINGREELVTNGKDYLEDPRTRVEKIYTLSKDGKYIIQNSYDAGYHVNYKGTKKDLEPSMKVYFKDSRRNLWKIAKEGGLL